MDSSAGGRRGQSQVQLGVALPWGVRDAGGQLLLARGQVLHDSAQLDALLARGATVDASEVRAVAAAAAAARAAQQSASNHPATLFALWEKLLWELERVLKSASDPEGFVARVEAVATHLVALVDRDPDIAIFLAVRQNPRRFSVYPLTHATHTAVVVLLMARRMGWPAAQVLTLVKAALTMNIATLPLQGRMAAQGVGITPEQHAIVRAHTVAGAAMLEAAGCENVSTFDNYEDGTYGAEPGLCIHEMGTARMGRDEASSVLNGFNQLACGCLFPYKRN